MMSLAHIDCVPVGGLCNRLRAMASVVQLADDCRADVRFLWQIHPECAAPFDALFEALPRHNVAVISSKRLSLIHHSSRKRNGFLPAVLRRFRYDVQQQVEQECTDERLLEEICGAKKAFFLSGFSVYKHAPVRALFVPVPEIQRLIDSVRVDFAPTTIGLHIRRTDHDKSIAHNTIQDYVDFIQSTLERDAAVRFFLASDDYSVKNYLTTLFPGCILQTDAVLERNSLKGMQAAVVDLFSLAACNQIVGSYQSSYTDMAAELGAIPLQILS